MANKLIPYNSELRERARQLRKNATEAECIFWEALRKRKLGVQFHRQVPMLDYIVDFYCHEIGLAIEIDGSSHESTFLYDAKRQGRLEKEGVKFLRFTNKEVKSGLTLVLNEITQKIIELTTN